MKKLAVIFIALGFSVPTLANEKLEARVTRAKYVEVKHEYEGATKQAPKRTHVTSANGSLSKLIERSNQINALYGKVSDVPVIWEGDNKILTGKTYRGILLNSIVSTNLASPVLVRAKDGQGLPYKTHFACSGVTQNHRVLTLCPKMILIDREIAISAQVLNTDGSAGLLGDYDDGKEDLIAGAIISDFSQGMLSAAQSRIASPVGEMRDGSVKNQVLQGLINSGGTTSEILLDDMKNVVPVVTIPAGSEVLIYFMEAVNEL